MKYIWYILRAVFLIIIFPSSGINGENNATDAITENFSGISTEKEKPVVVLSEDEMVLKKWRRFETILKTGASEAVKNILPYMLRFSEGMNISSKCSNSIMKTIYGIKAMKLWAYKMVDSSGKIPNGVLGGYVSSLGDFDGCLSIDVPGSNPFRGQYCTVFVKPPVPKRRPFHNVDHTYPLFVNFSKKGTVIEELARYSPHLASELSLRTSICFPSTCSQGEIQAIVDNIVVETEFPWIVTIPTCNLIEPLVFSKNDMIIICILSVIGLIAFTATVTDVVLRIISMEKRLQVEASSTAVKCLMCFSTYTNTLRLLQKDASPHSIKIFHGLKFITLLWVILNHSYYFTNFNLLGRVLNAREFGKQLAFQVIINGLLNVETFFFISAVLVAYGRMKFTGKNISIPLYIFRRVWRLTPPLMLIIATAMLTPHMGSGPGWKETMNPLIDKCKANWWTNLIFINNFLNNDDMCFLWLWYIAVDTHLYLLALFVLVPIKSRPRLALGMNVTLFLVGIITTAAAHVYYQHHPVPIYVFSHQEDRNYFIDKNYFRSYTHITTCSIGLCTGYILATKPKLKIPTILNVFAWLTCFTLGLVVVYGAYDWNQGNVPGMAVSTLYMCTHKVVWALALSYMTIACFTGNGGVITSILSWAAIVPFSRLTYVAYIIHPIIQLMFTGSTRIPIAVDHKTIVYLFLANIISAYGFAYIISLLFESPFMCLEKVMFSRRITAKTSQKSKLEENGNLENQLKGVDGGISTINIKKIENVP